MIRINIPRHLFFSLILLLGILVLETFTDVDMMIQRLLYKPETSSWMLTTFDHQSLRIFFYDGPKIAVGCIGLLALIVLARAFKTRNQPLGKRAFTLFMSIVLVPLVVAGSKSYTNIHCPDDLTCFGGRAPYQRILSRYEHTDGLVYRGRCFPAGHATGGFALMALFFCFTTPKRQLAGLATGLIGGWTMGIYQMLRGEHFLSHTLTSMVAAWIIILLASALPYPFCFFGKSISRYGRVKGSTSSKT